MFKLLATTTKSIAAVSLAAVMLGGAGLSASAAEKIGVLECNVEGGFGLIFTSQKSMACTFNPDRGRPEHYTGWIRKFGLDLGMTSSTVILWGVLSEHSGHPRGALAGHYVGASAEASIVVGAGANALVGGSDRSVALQPVSVQGQRGVNLAVGVTSLDLEPAR